VEWCTSHLKENTNRKETAIKDRKTKQNKTKQNQKAEVWSQRFDCCKGVGFNRLSWDPDDFYSINI